MGNWWLYIVIGVVLVGMILLTVIPQKKRQKQQQQMMDSLAVGTKIMTIGRMVGKITQINPDNTLVINVGTELSPTLIVIDRNAVGLVLENVAPHPHPSSPTPRPTHPSSLRKCSIPTRNPHPPRQRRRTKQTRKRKTEEGRCLNKARSKERVFHCLSICTGASRLPYDGFCAPVTTDVADGRGVRSVTRSVRDFALSGAQPALCDV